MRWTIGPIDVFDAFRAAELAPKHSIQVKFEDIDRVDMMGDTVTFILSKLFGSTVHGSRAAKKLTQGS